MNLKQQGSSWLVHRARTSWWSRWQKCSHEDALEFSRDKRSANIKGFQKRKFDPRNDTIYHWNQITVTLSLWADMISTWISTMGINQIQDTTCIFCGGKWRQSRRNVIECGDTYNVLGLKKTAMFTIYVIIFFSVKYKFADILYCFILFKTILNYSLDIFGEGPYLNSYFF